MTMVNTVPPQLGDADGLVAVSGLHVTAVLPEVFWQAASEAASAKSEPRVTSFFIPQTLTGLGNRATPTDRLLAARVRNAPGAVPSGGMESLLVWTLAGAAVVVLLWRS